MKTIQSKFLIIASYFWDDLTKFTHKISKIWELELRVLLIQCLFMLRILQLQITHLSKNSPKDKVWQDFWLSSTIARDQLLKN